MLKNLKNKKKKGFTLIELIIVIAIIAILAALAIPKFSSVRNSANLKSDIANAKTIANAASALLAEGTITASDTLIELDDATASSPASKIRTYLQTVPAPKAGDEGEKFIVATENGDVIVYIAADSDDVAPSNQVYPEPIITGTPGTNKWYPELGTATK